MEGKISTKVTRDRGSINSRKAKQLVLYLWILSAISKKKIMGAKKAEQKMLLGLMLDMFLNL